MSLFALLFLHHYTHPILINDWSAAMKASIFVHCHDVWPIMWTRPITANNSQVFISLLTFKIMLAPNAKLWHTYRSLNRTTFHFATFNSNVQMLPIGLTVWARVGESHTKWLISGYFWNIWPGQKSWLIADIWLPGKNCKNTLNVLIGLFFLS